jgi:hypothetical protein
MVDVLVPVVIMSLVLATWMIILLPKKKDR